MRYLTPVEVAEFTGFAVKTLANWRSLGTGPPFVRAGRRIRYWEEDVQAWMRDGFM